ncbi:MAG TPA: hypothetical protein DCX07_14160 [Phycisphaerales bacterium]|nr:hypothetical protein [Phycisphaerales bacterium]
MSEFCQDRDLLGIEPGLFLGGGFAAQQIAQGTGGQISGTTFTSPGSDFSAAGVAAGMVLCVYDASPDEGVPLEILAVPSATTLTVSVLRAEADGPAVPPAPGESLSFRVRTFRPQIRNASAALAEKLRQLAETAGVQSADFADSSQLRLTAAYLALAGVFVAQAQNAAAHDAHWIKAEHYRRESVRMQLQLRLAADEDGDGFAERTRTLGHVTLRRS